MKGTVYDVPTTKRCCTNCEKSFLNPRPELSGLKELGKFPLCTCTLGSHHIIDNPRNDVCDEFFAKSH